MKHFKKLKLASAISLAVITLSANATLQLNGDTQLTDETYGEPLVWAPDGAEDSLTLSGVTIDGLAKGGKGLSISETNSNTITVSDSNITAGETGYSLHLGKVTDSNILLENTNLLGGKGNPYLYYTETMSGSSLTIKDSTLDAKNTEKTGGGSRGISIVTVDDGSSINLDNTNISNTSGSAINISNIVNNSSLNINDSTIDPVTGSSIYVDTLEGSSINLGNTNISGAGINVSKIVNSSSLNINDSTIDPVAGTGIYVDTLEGSNIAITGSEIHGEAKSSAIHVINATDSDILISDTSLLDSTYLYSNDNLSNTNLTIKNSILGTESVPSVRGITVNGGAVDGSIITVDNTKISGTTEYGIYVENLDDSTVNIQNGVQITDSKTGVKVNTSQNANINMNNILIDASETGFYLGKSSNATVNINGSDINAGVGDGFSSQTFGVQLGGEDSEFNIESSKISAEGSDLGAIGVRFFDSVGSTLNITNSEISTASSNQEEGAVSLYLNNTNDSVANVSDSKLTGALGIRNSNNNTINITNSSAKGDVIFYYDAEGAEQSNNNKVNFDGSYLEGSIHNYQFDSATDTKDYDGSNTQKSSINFINGSEWKATGTSNIENISVTDSTVDMQDAVVSADNWTSQNADVLVNTGTELNINTGTGDMDVVIKSDGKELDSLGKSIVSVNSGDLDIHADAVDVGAYKYELVEKDGKWVLSQVESDQGDVDQGDVSKPDTPTHPVLSNSANAVLSSLASSQASWNSQIGTVYERMGARLPKDSGGVWGSYYGNEWAGKAGLSSTFNQKINGVAIGADKTLALSGGQLTLGAAIMYDYSHLSDFDEKGSGGSVDSAALQAYGSLELNNGLFFKGTASAGRTDSSLHVRSSDGTLAKGDYKQTLFGLTGQAGYRYQVTEDIYVAPYAQMNGYTASGADFKLDNGMKVSSDRYWSARGELGIEAGMNSTVGGITVTPHIMAAGSHEFVKNNDVHLNDLRNGFNNTVDGSGYKFGAGIDAQLTKSFSAGVNVSYSRSKDEEQRYGINAGLRYSF